MTTAHKLRKRYNQFTVVERVNLVLAAQERGDEDEVNALEIYCSEDQSVEYDMRVLRLALAASALVVQLLAREVLTVKRLEDLLHSEENDQNAKEGTAHPVHGPLDLSIANDRKLASLLEQTAAIWNGFSAWCRDLGHDPHRVLRLAPMVSVEMF